MHDYDLASRHRVILTDMPSAVRENYIHPSYRHYNPLIPEYAHTDESGGEAYLKGYYRSLASFPDHHTEAVWVIRDGDKTAARWQASGTFKGQSFGAIQPNNKTIAYSGMTIYRWVNGQVVEGMSLYDVDGFMRQVQA